MFAEQMSLSLLQILSTFSKSLMRDKGKTLEGNPRPLLGRSLAFLINLEQGSPVRERWEDFLRPGV